MKLNWTTILTAFLGLAATVALTLLGHQDAGTAAAVVTSVLAGAMKSFGEKAPAAPGTLSE